MLSGGLSNELLEGKLWVPARCSCCLISWSVSLFGGLHPVYIIPVYTVGIAQWLNPSGAKVKASALCPHPLGLYSRGFAAACLDFGPWEEREGCKVHLLPFPNLPFSLPLAGSAGRKFSPLPLLVLQIPSCCCFSPKQRETTNEVSFCSDNWVTAVLPSPSWSCRGWEAALCAPVAAPRARLSAPFRYEEMRFFKVFFH